MLMEHLGQTVDIDPRVAQMEISVIRELRKRGPTRQRDLWVRAHGVRVGRERFQQIIDSMVERRVIVRQATNRKDSFILRMPADARRRRRAQQIIALKEKGEQA